MRESDADRIARQGKEAWMRLKKNKNWNDWLQVGEALVVGRDWAMHEAGTNRPEGKGYNTQFGAWLTKYKLDDMDKGDRSRLFKVMDNRGAVEQWRDTLTLPERMKLNHPNSVWRKYESATKPPRQGPQRPTLRDNVVRLDEENAAKDSRIAELEAQVEELEAARSHPGDDGERQSPTAAQPMTIEAHFQALLELMRGFSAEEVTGHINCFLALWHELTTGEKVEISELIADFKEVRAEPKSKQPTKAKQPTKQTKPEAEFKAVLDEMQTRLAEAEAVSPEQSANEMRAKMAALEAGDESKATAAAPAPKAKRKVHRDIGEALAAGLDQVWDQMVAEQQPAAPPTRKGKGKGKQKSAA
jgi:hypothetical protein